MEFTIREIISLLIKKYIIIIGCTTVGLISMYMVSRYVLKPYYTTTVQMYVNPNMSEVSSNLNDLNYAQKLVATYIKFLQTKKFYGQVLDETGVNLSIEQLKGMTSIEPIGNTEIFQINVTSTNPQLAFDLISAMEEIAPVLIQNIKYTAQISVVDPPTLPTSPSGPNSLNNSILGGFVCFAFSILAILLWEITDTTLRNQEKIESTKIPILGVIPDHGKQNRKRFRYYNLFKFLGKKKIHKRPNIEIKDSMKFVVNEAYKSLRMNLNFTLLQEGCKKIMINSPLPGEGKSTTAICLGISLAQSGVKTLIIDCDLRKGRLNNFFKIPSKPGLSEGLSGQVDIRKSIHETGYKNLYVITMGSIPPNPSELLGSMSMFQFIKGLESEFDYIIFDTPPVNVVSDALSLLKIVDGVILVVRENMTKLPSMKEAISKYEFAKANLLGIVLNGVAIRYQTKKGYDYGYGEDDD